MYNATILSNVSIVIKLPEDIPSMKLILRIIIADNHVKKPMWRTYNVKITVPDPVEQSDFYFDAEALLKKREKKK